MARQRIPGVPSETEVALLGIIDKLQRRLDALERKPTAPALIETNFFAREGQFLRIAAPSAGIAGLLPKATPFNRGAEITLSFETTNDVRIECVGGTVNGEGFVINTAVGTYKAISDGENGWNVALGVSSSGSAVDATYHVQTAHGSLPNARVATTSTEIEVDNTVANVVSWALRTASVVFSKLQDLTGLSVLGRAANSAGVMAAITASAANQVLKANAAGTALTFERLAVGALADVTGPTLLGLETGTGAPEALTGAEAGHLIKKAGFASATIAADTNNLSPTGLADVDLLTVTATGANRTVTGLDSSVFEELEGTWLCVRNSRATLFAVTLAHNSGSSLAANRFICPNGSSYVLPAGESALLWYGTTGAGTGWQVMPFGSRLTGPEIADIIRGSGANITVTGTINNWAPAGASTANWYRLTLTGDTTITGLDVAVFNTLGELANGRELLLFNTDTVDTLTLVHASASSTSTNRFSCPGGGNLLVPPGGIVKLIVDTNVNHVKVVPICTPGADNTMPVNISGGTTVHQPRALSSMVGDGLDYNATTHAWEVDVTDIVDNVTITEVATNNIQRAALTGFAAASAGSNATTSAEPIVTFSTSSNMSNERVATSSTSVAVSTSVAGQIEFQRAALTGEVTASANSNTTAITRSTDFVWTGTHEFSSDVYLSGGTYFDNVFNGTTGNQPWFDLAIGSANVLRLDGAGAPAALLYSIEPADDGQLLWVVNVGSVTVVIRNEDTVLSTAANRIRCGVDSFGAVGLSLPQYAGVWLRYDGTLQRWTVASSVTRVTEGNGINVASSVSGSHVLVTVSVEEADDFVWTGEHVFTESASAPTVSAGQGAYSVANTAPSSPRFTDDAGTSHRMAYGNHALLATHYLTSGTSLVHTTGTRLFRVRGVGGGGAGGGAAAAVRTGGACGSAGAYCEHWFTLGASSSSYTVGAGGTGVSASAGNNGGNSTFTHNSVTITLEGGAGGGIMATGDTTTGISAGLGGTAIISTGSLDLGLEGQEGGAVQRITDVAVIQLAGGGSTPFGAGARARANGAGSNGEDGFGFGSGGSGGMNGSGSTARTGGDGGPGIWIVEDYG